MRTRTDGEPERATRSIPYAQPPRVLLADDDPDLRDVLAEALRAEGFDVLEAKSGAQLLDMIAPSLLGKQGAPPAELVVSDLRMPGITGLSVLGGLRQLDRTLPFILITAFADPETHAVARRLGATAVLDKPFDVKTLIRLARDLLAGS